MRSPYTPQTLHAVPPVGAKTDAAPRGQAEPRRSFAALLADAEAVRDHVELARRAAGPWQGALHGAATLLSRGMPWLGLPLLERRPGHPRRGPTD